MNENGVNDTVPGSVLSTPPKNIKNNTDAPGVARTVPPLLQPNDEIGNIRLSSNDTGPGAVISSNNNIIRNSPKDKPGVANPAPPSLTSKRLRDDIRRQRFLLGKVCDGIYKIHEKFDINSRPDGCSEPNIPDCSPPPVGNCAPNSAHQPDRQVHDVDESLHDAIVPKHVYNQDECVNGSNNHIDIVSPSSSTIVNGVLVQPADPDTPYTEYFALTTMPEMPIKMMEKALHCDTDIPTMDVGKDANGSVFYNDYYIQRSLADIPDTAEQDSSYVMVQKYLDNHEIYYNHNQKYTPLRDLDDIYKVNPFCVLYTIVIFLILLFLSLFCVHPLCNILAALLLGAHIILLLMSEPESMQTYTSAYTLIALLTGSGVEYLFDIIKYLYDPFYKKFGNYYCHHNLASIISFVRLMAKGGGNYIIAAMTLICFMQKIRKNVPKISLHHIKLKGADIQKSYKKFPKPDPHKIPIRFIKDLPYIGIRIGGQVETFLVDTGCAFNLINSRTYDSLIKSGSDFELFNHNISLSSHSGPELKLHHKAARIPISFQSDSIITGNEKLVPFLIEQDHSSTNIIGMKAIKNLELEFGPGFRFLNLNPSPDLESPPPGWSIDPASNYHGKVALSCDPDTLKPKLEASFDGLKDYTGCIILSNIDQTPNPINGTLLHLSNGSTTFNLSAPYHDVFSKEKCISGRVATCSDNCPTDLMLAHDVVSGEDVHYQAYPSDLLMEVDYVHNLLDWFTENNLISEVFGNPDPHPNNCNNVLNTDPYPPEIHPDPFEIQTDPISIDFSKYESLPAPDKLSHLDAEIQVLDSHGTCLLCSPNCCLCSPSNLKNKILSNQQSKNGDIFTASNKLILIVSSSSEINRNYNRLGTKLCSWISDKKFRSLRLGNKIKNSPGLALTSVIFDIIDNNRLINPDTNPVLYKTINSDSVHELQFNVQNGLLEHRPDLTNDYIGLSEELLNPSEITTLHENYEADLKEVIKESAPQLQSFLYKVFSTYSESYISSPTDFGCLKHPDFRLDLKLKDGCEHLLPRHAPFHANAHMAKVVDRLVDHWTDIGLAAPSNITSHCSRLLIVNKKVSDRAFQHIKCEIEKNTEYRFRTNLASELYSIDPDLLTVKQICAIYRICLDSRDLNRICTDTVQRSQNPEICLQNLQIAIGGSEASYHKTDLDQLRVSDPYESYDFQYNESASGATEIQKEINKVKPDPDQKFFYSSIDISSAHTSVSLTDRAKRYLNFITPSLRIMIFLRAIFGLKSISSQFNGSLTSILRDMVSAGHVIIYADDILIISRDLNTHLSMIAEIARRFARHGLKINLSKSKFGISQFSYIGYIFSPSGIYLSEDRIDAITSFPPPTNKKAVQRLIGMLGFISKCIPAYSFNLYPLLSLLSEKKFRWTEMHENALNKIKSIVKQNLGLHYVPADEPLSLFVDSSAVAGGGVLFAGEPNTKSYRPILYLSKKYSPTEIRRHSALECEISMLLYALEKIQYFTNGIRPISVFTDAKTIIYLLFGSRRTKNPKLSRMASKISEYMVNYNIQYAKPTIPELKMADCLSRLYYDEVPKLPGDLVKLIAKEDISLPPPGNYSFQELETYVIENDCINISKYLPYMKLQNSVPESTDLSSGGADPANNWLPHPPEGSGSPAEPVDGLDSHISYPSHHPETIHNIEPHKNIYIRFHSINQSIPPRIDDLSWKNIAVKQQSDPAIKEIIDKFSPQDILEEIVIDDYSVINGLLYKVNQKGKSKIYIPASLLNLLVSSAHIQYGHMGHVKLSEILNLHFFNPDLAKTSKNLVSKCHLCSLSNPNCLKKQKIKAFRFASQPNEVLGIDFMAMKADYGYKNILVVCDLFSGYTFLKPTYDQTADSVIQALKQIFAHVGAPTSIRSDGQLSLIKSKKMKDFFAEHKIQGEIYPPHYTYHNPKTERTIRSVRELIRYGNVRDKNFKWVKSLPMYNSLLNSIPRKLQFRGKTMFLSPFEIFFNRERKLFSVAHSDRFSDFDLEPKSLLNEPLRDFARGALIALKNDYVDKVNRKRRDPVIKVGDCYRIANKKTPREGGVPLKYQERFHENVYLARKISGKNILGTDILTGLTKFTSLDNIKLLHSRDEYFSELPQNVKMEMGSQLDLKFNLENRRLILKKLQDLKNYSRVLSPVATLNSCSSSSGSIESGSQDLIPNLSESKTTNPNPILIKTTGLGQDEFASPHGSVPRPLRPSFPKQGTKISQSNPAPSGSATQGISIFSEPSPRSPAKKIMDQGKKIKNQIDKILSSNSGPKSPRPVRIRKPNRDPNFVYYSNK